jgi:hypothetical protein
MTPRFSPLLLLLAACGGVAPHPAASRVTENRETAQSLCEFRGEWYGSARFDAVETSVSSGDASARLLPARLDLQMSSGGWHLDGHVNLDEGALGFRNASWIGEGVAVERGRPLVITHAEAGRVRVEVPPAFLEHMTFAQPPASWFGCDALDLPDRYVETNFEGLNLPVSPEQLNLRPPFALSHDPAGAPFVEVRRTPLEESDPSRTAHAHVLERGDGRVRIRVDRYSLGSSVTLVGWVDAALLTVPEPESGDRLIGNLSGTSWRDFDHESCESASALPLHVEVANERVVAGRVDAGTPLSVEERDEHWALVRFPNSELRLPRGNHVYVPSESLRCTPARGTHLRETHRVQVSAVGLECGTECDCELRLARKHEGQGSCQARLQCGDEVVYNDGYFPCSVEGGHVSGADLASTEGPEQEPGDGDPRFRIDGQVLSASDEAGGRLGAFRLEGRIL